MGVTPGVKLPILTEIVSPSERATTMALLGSLEGSLGGILGPPSVGFLAEHVFHYHGLHEGESQGAEVREQNGHALGLAMLWCTLLPWLLQAAVFFPLLHLTYSKDSAKMRNYSYDRKTGEDALELSATIGSSTENSVANSPRTAAECI